MTLSLNDILKKIYEEEEKAKASINKAKEDAQKMIESVMRELQEERKRYIKQLEEEYKKIIEDKVKEAEKVINEINTKYSSEYKKLEMLKDILREKLDDVVKLFIEKL
ncbi:MAG: hypothetical protein J7K58_00860 [Euryarchaeota archaeon]|nr:hypothetical protein [Euryarchaeota archaeon]